LLIANAHIAITMDRMISCKRVMTFAVEYAPTPPLSISGLGLGHVGPGQGQGLL
jgi:hypothetical protein